MLHVLAVHFRLVVGELVYAFAELVITSSILKCEVPNAGRYRGRGPGLVVGRIPIAARVARFNGCLCLERYDLRLRLLLCGWTSRWGGSCRRPR